MSTPPKGVIFDQGYRRYEGVFGGRGYALWTMIWADFQRALGIKKSWGYRLFIGSFFLFILGAALILMLPAFIPSFMRANTELPFLKYPFSSLFDWSSLWILLISAMIAADLLCNDRRFRVISLFLARPIERLDYLFAKAAAICGVLWVSLFVPAMALFAAHLLLAPEGAGMFFEQHTRDFIALVASSVLYAIFYGVFAMAISSLTVSRAYATAGTISLVFACGLAAFLLFQATQNAYILFLLDLDGIVFGLKNALFGTVQSAPIPVFSGGIVEVQPLDAWVYAGAYVAFVAACGAVIYAVYRREGI
jgi:ABC-2 type transport system permease protein